MPALDDIIVEMDFGGEILDTNGNNLLDTFGANLLDTGYGVCADVLDAPITLRRGVGYASETERVADAGVMKLVLDNSINNSAGLMGLYSPDSGNLRLGFGIGTIVRLNLPYSTDYYKFMGRITRIEPDTGLLGEKRVAIEVSDWMDIAARTLIPRIAVQTSATDDEVLTAIIAALDTQPYETEFDVGDYTYAYALSDINDERMTVMNAMQRLALSGLGRIYVIGGTVSGEKLIYESHTEQTTEKALVLDLLNEFTEMKAYRAAYERVRQVNTTVYPMDVDTAPSVVYSLPSSITLAAGASATFTAFFRDTSTGGRDRLSVVNPVTPVSNTDYKLSSVNGSGNDLNASLGVTVEWGGNSAQVTVTNNHGSTTGYLWLFNLRAYGLYRNDPMQYVATETAIAEGYGQNLDYRMPYQASYNVGRDVAIALLDELSDEESVVSSVEIIWNVSEEVFEAARTLECGDRVGVSDDVTGITNVYTVIGFDLSIQSVGFIKQTLRLLPFRQATFAQLDIDGLSELDGADTNLGY